MQDDWTAIRAARRVGLGTGRRTGPCLPNFLAKTKLATSARGGRRTPCGWCDWLAACGRLKPQTSPGMLSLLALQATFASFPGCGHWGKTPLYRQRRHGFSPCAGRQMQEGLTDRPLMQHAVRYRPQTTNMKDMADTTFMAKHPGRILEKNSIGRGFALADGKHHSPSKHN